MAVQNAEQTLVLIKPDALKNSLTGYVLSLLSQFHTGLWFAAAKVVTVSDILAQQHYIEHENKRFYGQLIDYITGRMHYSEDPSMRRVVALVYQGNNAVKAVRDIVGPTDPCVARTKNPGCIRSLGTIASIKDSAGTMVMEVMENLVHASSNTTEAEREIKLWFRPQDIPPSMRIFTTEESDVHYYYHDSKLYSEHVAGSVCLLAPGEIAWKSDLETLRAISHKEQTNNPLAAVVAKYLINEQRDLN